LRFLQPAIDSSAFEGWEVRDEYQQRPSLGCHRPKLV
jgi:hypothetical protein